MRRCTHSFCDHMHCSNISRNNLQWHIIPTQRYLHVDDPEYLLGMCTAHIRIGISYHKAIYSLYRTRISGGHAATGDIGAHWRALLFCMCLCVVCKLVHGWTVYLAHLQRLISLCPAIVYTPG